MTSRGKLQRIACSDIKTIGRNTQGVRIMSLDKEDSLAAVVRVPRDEEEAEKAENMTPTPAAKLLLRQRMWLTTKRNDLLRCRVLMTLDTVFVNLLTC